MKKKILLLIAMVSMLMCVFAISVSAETEIPEFTSVIDVTAEGDGVVEPIDVSSLSTLEAVVNDNTSRVLLMDENGNYATYLAKYITTTAKTGAGDYGIKFYFDALNAATGKEYDAASVIRFEIPEGVERLYSGTLSGCANLLTVKCASTFWVIESNSFHKSNCPSLKVIDFSASTQPTIKTTVSAVFANNDAVEEIRLPRNLVEMASAPFHNDSSLKRVYVPSTFTKTSSIVNGSTGKCAFFYTGDMGTAQSLFPSTLPTSITVTLEYVEWDSAKSDDYYVELAQNHSANDVIYIVCGYSECNAFYNNIHDYKGTGDCVDGVKCDRCTSAIEGEAGHAEYETLVYGSFSSNGVYNYGCSNEGCTKYDIVDKETAPIFVAKGYSTNANKNAINGGYSVNFEALELYTSLNGNLEYGIIIANANSFTGEFLNNENKVASQKAIQVEINSEYSNFDCSINYGANTDMELELVITAYVVDASGNVSYIQAESSYAEAATIGSNTFKKITLQGVVANQPVATKSDEE